MSNKRDHPQHKKRDIICEELPKHLQLSQVKKEPILPDWPSIYGTLLAGIKALFINLNDFKQLTVKQFTESADSINAISGKFQELKKFFDELKQTSAKEAEQIKSSVQTINNELKTLNQSINTEVINIKKQLESENTELKRQNLELQKSLNTAIESFNKTDKKQAFQIEQLTKGNQLLRKELTEIKKLQSK